MKEFIAIMLILSIILLFLVFTLMLIGILIEMIKEIKQWTKRKLVNNMNDKELLKTIQNDIKNIDEYIETCINDEEIDYLKSIKKALKEKQHARIHNHCI